MGVGEARESVECSPGTREALGSVIRLCQCYTEISVLERWRQEDQKFKIILGYIVNLRLA